MTGVSETGMLERLRRADWLKQDEMRAVFEALGAGGHVVRAVGGAVRDTLLGRRVSDVDLASDATPQEVMKLAQKAGLKAVATGIDHGTVTVIANGKPFEVTTLRCDVETYGRRARVTFTRDWEADARRRDFTINALYADPDGTLYDPVGGLKDIEAGRVRFIGDARTRIREDYLRILRFFRFCAELEATQLDAEALRACVSERKGLERLARERVHSELCRLLRAPGAVRVLQAMFDHGLLVGILASVPLLARLERLCALEVGYGRQPDAMLRLAALALHVEEDAARLAERFRLSKAEAEILVAASRYRLFLPRPDAQRARVLLYRLGEACYRHALIMAQAAEGRDAEAAVWRKLYDMAAEGVPAFPLKGADIIALGVPRGPRVGEVMRQVEKVWIESGFSSGRAALLREARAIAERLKKEE
ncbi:MAG: CCA tRNA nucleotidyltransferase [Alphaproteobacteria bacterium]|nr:MAG: CCA tRNA nucleotidyltransferase [Alphaproteobacteria bacterium]